VAIGNSQSTQGPRRIRFD